MSLDQFKFTLELALSSYEINQAPVCDPKTLILLTSNGTFSKEIPADEFSIFKMFRSEVLEKSKAESPLNDKSIISKEDNVGETVVAPAKVTESLSAVSYTHLRAHET